MHQIQTTISLTTPGRGLHEITTDVASWLRSNTGTAPADCGLLTLFCQHTSASLLINENAAPAVQRDLLRWLERIAPEGPGYEHDDEGPDDMPAHIRSLVTGNSLTIPFARGRLQLGTWQGIYLAEHRRAPHRRNIVAHIIGT